MNELKAVLKHLENKEVKLSSEKVELASVAELEKHTQLIKKLTNQIEVKAKEVEKAKNALNDVLDSYTKDLDNNVVRDFIRAADALGLKASDIPAFKEYKAADDAAGKMASKYVGLIK